MREDNTIEMKGGERASWNAPDCDALCIGVEKCGTQDKKR